MLDGSCFLLSAPDFAFLTYLQMFVISYSLKMFPNFLVLPAVQWSPADRTSPLSMGASFVSILIYQL